MATKDWNGFKKNGDTYIPNDATARTGLQNKVDKVTGKGLSTNDYDNTSKGIVDNIQDNVIANTKLIKDTVGWSGKNLCHNKATTKTTNGITFTVNSNGSVTVNGTATADATLFLSEPNEIPLTLNGTYVLSAGAVLDGDFKFTMEAPQGTNNNVEGSAITKSFNNVAVNNFRIFVRNGKTVNNVTIYPMLRDADILDDTYEPHFGSTAFPRSEQAVLGAKNLLKYDRKANATEATITIDKDGVIDINGTVTTEGSVIGNSTFDLPAGNYILSGCTGGSTSTYCLDIYESQWNNRAICEDGDVPFTFNSDTNHVIRIYLKAGTYDHVKFKPMIRVATDPDDTYVPYAMTNRELTKAVSFTHLTSVDIADLFVSDSDITDKSGILNKFGRIVTGQLKFKLAKTTVDSGVNIATLPDSLKPLEAVSFATYDAGSGSTTERHDIFFNANGTVQLVMRNIHSTTRWIHVNFTYISAL